MATAPQHGRERTKAAAWAWYERGAVSGSLVCRQGRSSTALMVRGKYMRSRSAGSENSESAAGSVQQLKAGMSCKRCLPPSRFKREAEALEQEWRHRRHLQASTSPDHQEACRLLQSDAVSTGLCDNTPDSAEAHVDHIPTSSPYHASASSTCLPSSSSPPPSSAHRPIDDPCHERPSDMSHTHSGDASPPPLHDYWLEKFSGSSSKKSVSSVQIDHELSSLISLFGNGAAATGLASQRSSLFDSFELQELLRKLDSEVKEAKERSEVEEPALKEAQYDYAPKEAQYDYAVEAHNHELQEAPMLEPKEALGPLLRLSLPENASSTSPAESVLGLLIPVNTSENLVSEIGTLVSNIGIQNSPRAESISETPASQITNCKKPMVEIDGLDMQLVSYRSSPPMPSHSKQTLHDLLQWSPRSSNTMADCDCAISDNDHFYYSCESPDINNVLSGSCNSSSCNNVKAAQRRRRRRPSLLMPHFTHSFSSALHHFPHLPHSFSNALHNLPHSLSNALHHLPHFPHSLSNAFNQIAHLTHSLSSAYKHHVASSHRHVDPEATPCHDANAHTHRQKPFHLRHLFSFKVHHSSPRPDIAVGGTSPIPDNYRSSPSAAPVSTLVHHHSKSPSRERRLSAPNEYMLIYSSTKKHSGKGNVHHHHHHHYHHYHYIL